MQTPHTSLSFVVTELVGVAAVTIQVTVAGQASNVLSIPITPPSISIVDIYDTSLFVSGVNLDVAYPHLVNAASLYCPVVL